MNFHPLGVAGPVVLGHQLAELRVVRVPVPTVVIPEVAAGVVRRIGEDEVDFATLPVKRHHGLEVLALDYLITGLLLLCTNRITWRGGGRSGVGLCGLSAWRRPCPRR